MREDVILARLPALHLVLTGAEGGEAARRRRTRRGADVWHQATAKDVIGYLRDQQITLTYNPAAGTLHAATCPAGTTVTLKAS